MSSGNFFTGTPGKWDQRSTLSQGQQPVLNQLNAANQGRGAGGTFGTLSDYYQNQFNDNTSDFGALSQPEMRRFNEQTIPELSEQFAGYGFGGGSGSGGLSSSAFRNQTANAGADLGERLAQIRAQIRQQSAQGLHQLGQTGLGNYSENTYTQGQPGLIDQIGPALGTAAGAFFGSPQIGGAIGSGIAGLFGNKNKGGEVQKGSTSPLGGNANSPTGGS